VVRHRPRGDVAPVGDAGDQREIVTVTHYRTSGAVVAVSGYNYDPTAKTAVKPLPAMPVTVGQLTFLATDAALGIWQPFAGRRASLGSS
jgi:hypothetical protein